MKDNVIVEVNKMDNIGRLESAIRIARKGGVHEVTPEVRVFRVHGDSDKSYIVRIDEKTGESSCNVESTGEKCPDWKHNLHEQGNCKHILSAKIEGGYL